MPNLLHLPAEILINVLSYLPGINLESCKLVNRDVRDIIDGSPLLRYLIAADLAGVEDNPRSQLSISEKLTRLADRELSWRKFEPDFIRSISVDHPPSGIYDLTNGIYVIDALHRPWLHYLELPTLPSQALAWSRLQVDPHHTIIDIALAVYESNLIAIITSAPDPTQDEMFRIELNLQSFRSGEAHPLAQQPAILIERTSQPRLSISIEVSGDFVALAVAHPHDPLRPNDQILVWNWKTGASLMRIDAEYRTYRSVMFLTGDILLVPNIIAATFEFWRIPSSSSDDVSSNPTHILGLPPLAAGMYIAGIVCRGEPNPLGPCSALHFDRPFRASPQQAIIIFYIHTDSTILDWRFTLTLVVHRRSLVDLVHKYPSLEGTPQSFSWADWGPPSTRWFANNSLATKWITTSAGQRFVSIPSARGPAPIIIYDFNPYNIAKMKNHAEHYPKDNVSWSEREEELERVPTIFEGPVRSALPYCRTSSKELYTYGGILMDEEMLIGLKTRYLGGVEAVDIMHFG